MLVAATAQGLRAVRFEDSREALISGFKQDFADTLLEEDAGRLAVYIDPLLRYLDGQAVDLAGLPLDAPASPFRQRVWDALRSIPPGETRTYRELTRLSGSPPTAIRAVGGACASNPVAVVIPCHRAVGSDGALTGYRWGIERKRWLLQMEKDRP
jgi:AraC family transcriptional regulator of adaptative response/methylated-DNA-[protein]-cysteine methyltransferase